MHIYKMCKNISNLSNNSEALKHLYTAMTEYLEVARVTCYHVDTMFGSDHFVMRDIKNWVAID